jgi:hypothetical protein
LLTAQSVSGEIQIAATFAPSVNIKDAAFVWVMIIPSGRPVTLKVELEVMANGIMECIWEDREVIAFRSGSGKRKWEAWRSAM